MTPAMPPADRRAPSSKTANGRANTVPVTVTVDLVSLTTIALVSGGGGVVTGRVL